MDREAVVDLGAHALDNADMSACLFQGPIVERPPGNPSR
jgi:hypothetical protein